MKLGIIGAGYVGLTTGICLASLDHSIIIYDIDLQKIEKIKQRKMPFFEKDLQDLLEKVIDSKNLNTTTNIDYLIQNTDACFICVGTPVNEDNSINISQVIQAINSIVISIKTNEKNNYQIIIRSTIVPGTTREKILPILQKDLSKQQFSICVTPEFLREGNAYHDFMNPDKIVIGGFNQQSIDFVENVFSNFKNKAKFIKTNTESAELIKYTNNAFFSMLISFANEMSNISEKIKNVDSFEVLQALITDKRISIKIDDKIFIPELSTYLIPGCGFGGSCFPKDIKAILNFADSQNVKTPILNAILKINDERPFKMVSLAESILNSLKNKKITILGLTFKPDTDDLRSSPSLNAIKLLLDKGAQISAYDPIISKKSKNDITIRGCKICSSLEESLKGSELVLVFTKWPEFKSLDGEFLNKFMKKSFIIDGRGFLEKKKFKNGTYYKIGYSNIQ